ncbi:hypothetical protein ACFU3O_11250 [Streptomyces antibioticus]|uniref:hypothetical protein n=1 Tax=Streptomyces antibioticus TaxID=1890 RepID=UPI0036940728
MLIRLRRQAGILLLAFSCLSAIASCRSSESTPEESKSPTRTSTPTPTVSVEDLIPSPPAPPVVPDENTDEGPSFVPGYTLPGAPADEAIPEVSVDR